MNRILLTITCMAILSGCGGGSEADKAVLPTPVVPPPVNGIADPIYPPDFSKTSCAGLDFLQLISVESEANSNSEFTANKAIDGDLSDESRWESTTDAASITIELGYRHVVKEIGTAWFNGDQNTYGFDISVSEDGTSYTTILTNENSSQLTDSFERFNVTDTVARFVRITSNSTTTALLEAAVFGCPLDIDVAPIQEQTVNISQYNLNPNAPPGENFDLLTWALDTPRTDPDDGFSLRASERELDNGFVDDDYFYTADDGGMVFRSTIFGAKTSANTSFTRSELREMLRRGNTGISTQGVNQNNWILGYQPDPQRTVGGRGGVLKGTLKIDHVTTDGSTSHAGRVIFGQIHADNDEPIRLYYKKFPDNERGYIYFAHEYRGGDDIWLMLLGPRHSNNDNQPMYLSNPEQGIALGEIFSYEIKQDGARIDVLIRRGDLEGPIIAHQFVDMQQENSGYDVIEEWNYFKAGAYSQNNTGNSGDVNGVGSDYDLITYYFLSNEHGPQ